MKTADLIPFILLELNECDKYGFELTKAIESKSNGKIIIKQPTLYTLLKKLEKSKFISSYWQDSEIGGKRHYYKITENGRLQVSTLPSYDFLLKNALSEDIELENFVEPEVMVSNPTPVQEVKKFSIMDELLNSNETKPEETILPTEEVFADKNIDNSTELDINLSNADILKDDKTSSEEQFATSQEVMKFTEKITPAPTISTEQINKTSLNNDFLDVSFTAPKNEINVKYVDYVNIKNSENYKYSKALSNNLLFKALATSASLIIMLVLCAVITNYTGRSAFYYFMFISSIVVAIFYPVLYIINKEKFRIKHQNVNYSQNYQKRMLIGCILLLLVFIIAIVVSICQNLDSITKILNYKNFSNFYSPMLMTFVYFLDLIYEHLFLKKLNK